MKRLFTLLLALTLVFAFPVAADTENTVLKSTQKLTVDGAEVSVAAYNIDGYNYVKLRALAAELSDTDCAFDVDYDEETKRVMLTRGVPYSGAAEPQDDSDASESAAPSTQKVCIDGVERSDLHPWNIADRNWFKLAELSGALGFRLSYDEASRTAMIETSAPVAGDYAAVYEALSAVYSGYRGASKAVGTVTVANAEETPAAAPMPESAAEDSASGGYTGTNVQVDGFDEGDIVKTDGTYLYVLRAGEELTILKAEGAGTSVISRTEVGWNRYEENEKGSPVSYRSDSKYPREMFVSDGLLAVISVCSSYTEGQIDGIWRYSGRNYTSVDIYDVSDPAAPKQTVSLGQDGSVLGTRMIGGKVYLVTNYWTYNWEEDDPATYVPALYKDGEMHILPADHICICPECSSTQYVVLAEYDLSGAECTASQSLLGGGDTLYMNDSGIYVMGSRWFDKVTDSYSESVYTVEEHRSGSETEIYRFDVADGLKLAASGKVPGYLESQFSADEYEGSFRIVTTRNESVYRVYRDEAYDFYNYRYEPNERSNGLYVLDTDLTVVGRIDELAPGEQVYSARFDGPVAYFCTFRNVDPLFAVDVSDPASPRVLSALKISGFSEYLHSWDEGRLFGFGREADEETGSSEQLKLVMFNTENKADVTVKHSLVLDDCWYSEALYDHKAFFIDPDNGIIGFVGDSEYFVYTYDDAAGFRKACSFTYDSWPGRVRGFRIGDTAYIVGEETVKVLDIGTWALMKTLELAK